MRVTRTLALPAAVALLALPPSAFAQFTIDGYPVQVHGFFSQGFMYSNQNNYLTANTSDGTFRFTDGGLNISSQLSSKLHVGAQGYVRSIGQLGKGHVTLDWALADYRLNDRFGIRAGRVKTVLGLYNDTQDVEYLHTWAILPQSLYPTDLRGSSISHLGGDIYGSFRFQKAGTFSYTAYAGSTPKDFAGGLQYGLASYGLRVNARTGSLEGADLKWATPVDGLLLGASYLNTEFHLRGSNINLGGDFRSDASAHTRVFSAQYMKGAWKIEGEYSRALDVAVVHDGYGPYGPPVTRIPYDLRGWYAATTYRLTRYLELGAYHSRFYPNADQQEPQLGVYFPAAARHIYDQAITARFDFKSYWDLKVEGHFMDGYGDPGTSRGFYPQDNPAGLQPKTNLLVIRLGFNR